MSTGSRWVTRERTKNRSLSMREACRQASAKYRVPAESVRGRLKRVARRPLDRPKRHHGKRSLSDEQEKALLTLIFDVGLNSYPLSAAEFLRFVNAAFKKNLSYHWMSDFKKRHSQELKRMKTRLRDPGKICEIKVEPNRIYTVDEFDALFDAAEKEEKEKEEKEKEEKEKEEKEKEGKEKEEKEKEEKEKEEKEKEEKEAAAKEAEKQKEEKEKKEKAAKEREEMLTAKQHEADRRKEEKAQKEAKRLADTETRREKRHQQEIEREQHTLSHRCRGCSKIFRQGPQWSQCEGCHTFLVCNACPYSESMMASHESECEDLQEKKKQKT